MARRHGTLLETGREQEARIPGTHLGHAPPPFLRDRRLYLPRPLQLASGVVARDASGSTDVPRKLDHGLRRSPPRPRLGLDLHGGPPERPRGPRRHKRKKQRTAPCRLSIRARRRTRDDVANDHANDGPSRLGGSRGYLGEGRGRRLLPQARRSQRRLRGSRQVSPATPPLRGRRRLLRLRPRPQRRRHQPRRRPDLPQRPQVASAVRFGRRRRFRREKSRLLLLLTVLTT
mmetsp:Transcript_11627/g.38245  ORF Transcript_11627/g.38245 Transcript_11627/m.38245 type:complete len:231 (-) Transcript_11627:51-743(-)